MSLENLENHTIFCFESSKPYNKYNRELVQYPVRLEDYDNIMCRKEKKTKGGVIFERNYMAQTKAFVVQK